jgi:hypothetical protein
MLQPRMLKLAPRGVDALHPTASLLLPRSVDRAARHARARHSRWSSTTRAGTDAPLPLQGYRVLDMTRVLAGVRRYYPVLPLILHG